MKQVYTTFRNLNARMVAFGKNVFLIGSFILVTTVSLAQQYTYQFQIEGVEDLASAKDVTDQLRFMFNTTENAYQYFPYFNEGNHTFTVSSNLAYTQEALDLLMRSENLILQSFLRREIDYESFQLD